MRFTLSWEPDAEDELALIWVNAPNRQAVTDAADEIERQLQQHGSTVGTPLGPAWRLHIPPLEVVFTASPDDTSVRVIWVSYYP